MKTQLFLDLIADPRHISVHFRDSAEVEETLQELRNQNVAVMEIDGSGIASREDLFRAFAIALQKPKAGTETKSTPPMSMLFLSTSMTLSNGCLRMGTLCSCASRNSSGAHQQDWLATLSNGGSFQCQVMRALFISCLFGDIYPQRGSECNRKIASTMVPRVVGRACAG